MKHFETKIIVCGPASFEEALHSALEDDTWEVKAVVSSIAFVAAGSSASPMLRIVLQRQIENDPLRKYNAGEISHNELLTELHERYTFRGTTENGEHIMVPRITEVPTAESLEAAGQTTLYCSCTQPKYGNIGPGESGCMSCMKPMTRYCNCAKPSRAIGKSTCVVCERPIK